MMLFVGNETPTASSRIWTWVAVSIFFYDNRYATEASSSIPLSLQKKREIPLLF